MSEEDENHRDLDVIVSNRFSPLLASFIEAGRRLTRGIEFFGRHPLVTGSLAILGVLGLLLSIVGYQKDRNDALSTTNQVAGVETKLGELQENLQSMISMNSTAIVDRISEILPIDAALIEEGPVRDLARLEKTKNPTKLEATSKLYSLDEKIVLDGANQLLDFASEKAKSVISISESVAEDYRQAGAAFLLARDFQSAFDAYDASTRFDPRNGFLSLSKIALAMDKYQAAEGAALSALKDADGFSKIFALEQIINVYIAQNDFSAAQSYLLELDTITTKDVLKYSEFDRLSLLEVGLDAVKKRNNEKTYFQMFWAGKSTGTLEVIDGKNMDEGEWKQAIEVAGEYTMAVISKELRLMALSRLYEFYSREDQPNSIKAEEYFHEAIKTAFEILNLINEYNISSRVLMPHIESYSNYLQGVGRHAERVGLWQSALKYLEAELNELQEDTKWIGANNIPVEVFIRHEKEPILGQKGYSTEKSLRPIADVLLRSLLSTYVSLIHVQIDDSDYDGALSSAQLSLAQFNTIRSTEISISEDVISEAVLYAELKISDVEFVRGQKESACSGYESLLMSISSSNSAAHANLAELLEKRTRELCSGTH